MAARACFSAAKQGARFPPRRPWNRSSLRRLPVWPCLDSPWAPRRRKHVLLPAILDFESCAEIADRCAPISILSVPLAGEMARHVFDPIKSCCCCCYGSSSEAVFLPWLVTVCKGSNDVIVKCCQPFSWCSWLWLTVRTTKRDLGVTVSKRR